jgi:leucyl-tRNA synthetase
VNYKLRDWLFSRQRFWGEPFPILHELDADGKPTGLMRAVPPSDLPVDLPQLDDFKPHGRPEPPLAKAPSTGSTSRSTASATARDEHMPQWAGSCWYYLRFIDPKNERARSSIRKEKYWMPVDLYVGGAEHAVLHLLYARFWHKVLFDRGHVSTPEPFQKLVNQGMILGESTLHKTIKQVTSDIERMEFNTAIARMMEFTNFFTKQSVRPHAVMEQFVLILSPFAPHIAEELWQLLGHDRTLAYEPWPQYDEALTKDSEIEIPVQILGKLRSKVVVPAGSDQDTIVAAARADSRIAELLTGKQIVKTIVVPGKLVNFVVR